MAFLIMSVTAACQKAAPPPPPPPKPVTRPSRPAEKRKPVNTKTQQQFYDQGLRAYSKENYEEARAAFKRVVELGSNSPLGLNAQENLRKIQQILKTVEEIESK